MNFIRQAFRRSDSKPDQSDAAPSAGEPAAFIFDSDLLSDVGCVRTNNEDSGRILRTAGGHGTGAQLVVVADGMGGYNAGEVASGMAVKTIEESYPEIRKKSRQSAQAIPGDGECTNPQAGDAES